MPPTPAQRAEGVVNNNQHALRVLDTVSRLSELRLKLMAEVLDLRWKIPKSSPKSGHCKLAAIEQSLLISN